PPLIRRAATATLLPYTTLFRSDAGHLCPHHDQGADRARRSVRALLRRRAHRSGHRAAETRERGERSPVPREPAHHRRVAGRIEGDRKSTRLNSSHVAISYAVFC